MIRYVSRFDIPPNAFTEGTDDLLTMLDEHMSDYYRVLALKHLGKTTKKPHIHFYFETDVKKTTIRSRFETLYKSLGLSGKDKQYQLPTICKDKDKYIYYLLGQSHTIYINNYTTPIKLSELTRESQLALASYKIKQSQERKEKKISYLQELINNYTRLPKPVDITIINMDYKRSVIEHVTTYVVSHFQKKCDKFILKQHIYPILFRVYPELFKKEIVTNITDSIAREFIPDLY